MDFVLFLKLEHVLQFSYTLFYKFQKLYFVLPIISCKYGSWTLFYSDFGKIEQFPSNDIAVEHIPTTRIEVEQFPSLYIRVHLKLETVLQDFCFFWHTLPKDGICSTD